jgi:hypothetical protein
MLRNESVGKLASALVQARAAIKHPARNRVNPHFRNKYADLTAVLDAVIPAFTANGLAIIQMVEGKQLVTMLVHTSGEFISTTAEIPPYNNAQQLGSALTYLRRYTVQALAGISADDDDDGNEAASVKSNKGHSTSDNATTDGDDW